MRAVRRTSRQLDRSLLRPDKTFRPDMMVSSKLNSNAMTPTADVVPDARSMTLDDFDPHNQAAQRDVNLKPSWARIRLAVLLSILIPLAFFGFIQNRQASKRGKIVRALNSWDTRAALSEIAEFEERFGTSSETASMQARAYRHLGDDQAFEHSLKIAQQLGQPQEKIDHERLLRDLHLGNVDNMRESMALAIDFPEADLEEIGPAIVYGFLSKLDLAGAEQFLVFWTKETPNSPWLPFFRGMNLMGGGKVSSAIETFEKCVRRHPNFIPVYAQLGVAYLRVSKNEKGIATLRRYLQNVPGDNFAAAALATALLNLDREDEVIQLLSPMIESNAANEEVRVILSRVFLAREDWRKVIEVLTPVAAMWPEDVRTADYLAQAYQAIGRIELASRFMKIVEDGKSDLDSIDERITRILSGEDFTAEKQFELGHILLHKKSREDGLYWLSSALSTDPTYLPAHKDLVTYYHKSKKTKLAVRHQKYIDLRNPSE